MESTCKHGGERGTGSAGSLEAAAATLGAMIETGATVMKRTLDAL